MTTMAAHLQATAALCAVDGMKIIQINKDKHSVPITQIPSITASVRQKSTTFNQFSATWMEQTFSHGVAVCQLVRL